jgi:hypothetical protein
MTLTNSKGSRLFPNAASIFCSGFPSISTVHFSNIGTFMISGRLSEQFSGSQAAFGQTFEATSFMKRVTGRILTISRWFHQSKQKLYFGCSHKKNAKKCENHQRSSKKYAPVLFCFFIKNNMHLVTLSFQDPRGAKSIQENEHFNTLYCTVLVLIKLYFVLQRQAFC